MLVPTDSHHQHKTSSWHVPFHFRSTCLSWTFLLAYSKAKCKSNGDEESPCFGPFCVWIISDKCLPIRVRNGNVVSIATSYGMDDWGVRVQVLVGVKNFHFSILSRPALGSTQLPIQWAPGALSLGVKRQGCEADHSPLTSAEVKKTWIYKVKAIPVQALEAYRVVRC
jgi:hypothetical protein